MLRGNPITFSASDGKKVQATGKATWHGRPGVAHYGSFSATAEPEGNSAEFREPPGRCQVNVHRRGPYLIVDDDSRCGGMNVRFQGIYVKRMIGDRLPNRR